MKITLKDDSTISIEQLNPVELNHLFEAINVRYKLAATNSKFIKFRDDMVEAKAWLEYTLINKLEV